MKQETLRIFPDFPDTRLVTYLHQDAPELHAQPHRAVIICPGGGYRFLSEREAEPVALEFLAAGFQVFILYYGIGSHATNWEPLTEACGAVRYVREHAAEWNLLPDKIMIAGFSAGGHCAASCGTLWKHPAVREAFLKWYGDTAVERGRPDGTILSYPVITAGPYAHRDSILALCGAKTVEEAGERGAEYSLECFVDGDTAPSFLWTTASDALAPCQNTLLYAMALANAHVPLELHIFPEGAHGLSLADQRTWCGNPALLSDRATEWIRLAIRWAMEC